MTHIRKFTNGRRYSVCLDGDQQTPSYFVHLTTKSAQDKELQQLVAKSWDGFKSGYSPSLCSSGVGGTYFLQDKMNNRIGVFKPHDEEMGMLNNPKGFTPDTPTMKEDSARRGGVLGGEAAFRECAAYILDKDHFAGVPATDIVLCTHPSFKTSPVLDSGGGGSGDVDGFEARIKLGSFQEFKEHDYDTEDISPKEASKFPNHEVHKIAILDMRMFNTDRHGGNILVRKIKKQTTKQQPPPLRLTPSVNAYRPPSLRRFDTSSSSSPSSRLAHMAESPPDLVIGGDEDEDEEEYGLPSSMDEESPTLSSHHSSDKGKYSPNGADTDTQFDMELDDDDSHKKAKRIFSTGTTTTYVNPFIRKSHQLPSSFPIKPLPSSFSSSPSSSPPYCAMNPTSFDSSPYYSTKSSYSTQQRPTTALNGKKQPPPPPTPTEETYELIPIDHGYTLPHTLSLPDCWFEWLNWPQSKVPFSPSDLLYIHNLNSDADAQLLKTRLGDVISSDCLKIMKICTMWLQIGAKYGLTPNEIGGAMCRRNIEVPSELEVMNDEAVLYSASSTLSSSLLVSPLSSSAPSLSSSSDSVLSSSSSPQDFLFFSKLEEIMKDRALLKIHKK